ncbi:hypothetical protein ACFX1W_037809 [Malus domestica]
MNEGFSVFIGFWKEGQSFEFQKQMAKSTEGIANHDEHLGNAVEKTDGLRFWGRTIACDGEINGERRFDVCTMTSGSRIEIEWLGSAIRS